MLIIECKISRQHNIQVIFAGKTSTPSSTEISLGDPGDGLTDELDVQFYVPWASSENPNVTSYDIKMRYPRDIYLDIQLDVNLDV